MGGLTSVATTRAEAVIVIFNLIGLMMLAAAFLVGLVAGVITRLLTNHEGARATVGIGAFLLTATLLDLWYRWVHYRDLEFERVFLPKAGGQLFFLPLWVICGVIPLLWGVRTMIFS
jgi:hypothetical protein